MKRIDGQQWFYSVIALVLLAALLISAVWLVAKAIESGETFIAGSLAAFATVAAAGVARHYERKKQAEATRREYLGKLYEDLASALAGEGRTQQAVRKTILQFRRRMLVYAGPGVVQAFTTWSKQVPEDEASESEWRLNHLRFEALVKAMRHDLGISSFGLSDGDLARAVIDDWDRYGISENNGQIAVPETNEGPRVRDQRTASQLQRRS
jgi:hypothetical protein